MFLMALMVLSGIADVVSLGAVLPFLGALTAPERVLSHPYGANLARLLGIHSADQLIAPLTVIFTVAVLIAGAIHLVVLWLSTRLAYASGADLSMDVYRRTLYQPYWVHVSRNSSEIISGITNKVNGTVNVLYQLQTVAISSVSLIAMTFALLVIDPVVAAIASVGFGASYALISLMARRRLRNNSRHIAAAQTQVIKVLREGLGGIRDMLLDGTQAVYCDVYRQADVPLRRMSGANAFIGGSPRYVMESVGMVLIAGLAYGVSRQQGGIANAVPMLGALALGAQRLLPALQQSYSAWASIAGSQASLADTIELLGQPVRDDALEPPPASLPFAESIRFENVHFRYSGDGPWVLEDLNFAIPKGARVGLVGSTGSGKSTATDLLMGLLLPTEGRLVVDGQPISGARLRAWQQAIAHVPQSIYLADTTLAENIAFGVPKHAIDLDRVKQAARQAQIADFIDSRPEGYQASVGERGVRLSGGQRQRIGIARALYKRASVLVFDEATSALDNLTEQSVMEAIEQLNRDLTILIVAHRLTTVRRCDTIIELEHGEVVAQGTYEHLLECSPTFRRTAS